MGMEADGLCRWSGGEAQVKALLEADALILRGGLKRTLPRAGLQASVEGDDLVITADDTYRLTLGAAKAARWKTKIETPPPTLRAKLGLGAGATAHVIGDLNDPALRHAVDGASGCAAEAKVCIAEVASDAALLKALATYAEAGGGKPLWLVHGKGPKADFGEAAVRALMRARGFIDSKACAVSETRSATRYAPR